MRNRHLLVLVTLLFSVSAPLVASSFSFLPQVTVIAAFFAINVIVALTPRGTLIDSPIEWRWLAQCLVISLLFSMVGGQGHFIFAKDDWLFRDAVLADVTKSWLPVVYAEGSETWLLRAPLGMYLLPGGVGHLLGLRIAHLVQLAQNSIILAGIFYFATLLWPRRRLLFIALFILFSGVDVIPVLLKTRFESLFVNLSFWSDAWQYSSNVSQYFWSPNHALPGWFFAVAAALYLKLEIDLAALAALSLPLVFWSPLALVGALALFAFFVLTAPRNVLSRRFAAVCVAAAAFFPVLSYLGADAGDVPREWLFLNPDFFDNYALFIFFALPQAFLLLIFRDRIEPWLRGALLFSIVLLLVIPVYSVGDMNDFSQRVPIAPRALLAFGFDALVIDLVASGPTFTLFIALSIVAMGAVTPFLELYDSIGTRAFAASDCSLLTVQRKLHPKTYLATYLARLPRLPDWMSVRAADVAPRTAEDRVCWPDRVYGESLFNWLKPENRIWLRAPAQEKVKP